MRHAPRAPAPRRLYAEPYERPPARRTALRRLLARPRPRARAPRLPCVVYSLLPARSPALATVVYSDRYFRYGLPLRTAPHARAHHAPLPAPTPRPPRAGVLVDATTPAPYLSPRYVPLHRGRRDLPRLFVPPPEARPDGSPPGEYPTRLLPLDYRQPTEGVEPREAIPMSGELRRRRESPISERSYSSESAPRPEFALPDEEFPSRAPSAESVDERSGGPSAASAYVAYETYKAPPAPARPGPPPRRPPAPRRAARRGSSAQRRAVRALLALSGATYALALLAFYFLSLA